MTSLTVAPLRVLKDPQDQSYYEILERIGEGTFSVVYRAQRKETLVNDEPTNSRHRQNKKRKSSRNKEVKMTIYNDTNSDNRRDQHTIVALKCIHPNSSPKRILNELRFLKTLGGKNGCLPFVPNQNMLVITFIICPKVDDFLWWGGVVGGGVYGGKMDFCWLYGLENTDRMDIWVKERKKR